MDIALTEDLQRRLRTKVENGEFPNEQAVVEEALKCFLIQEPPQGRWHAGSATEALEARLPGPFIEGQTACPPVKLPRHGREIACSDLHDPTR